MLDMLPLLTIAQVAELAGATVGDVKKMPIPYYQEGRSRLYGWPDLVEAGLVEPIVAETKPEPVVEAWVYFVSYRQTVKIGTAKKPKKRFAELQCGSPVVLRMLGIMPGDKILEAELHERWAEHRYRGEWFHITPDIRAFIKANCRDLM